MSGNTDLGSAGGKTKRLVVLRFSALGDIAMTVPVIYSVAQAYPEMEIYVVTRPFFSRMFINAPENVSVISFDLKNEYRGLCGIFRIASELAHLRPDFVADLHDLFRTRVISICLRMRGGRVETVNKTRGTRKTVFAGGPSQRWYIDRYFDVFRSLGLDAQMAFRSVYGDIRPMDIPTEILAPAVGIAPFARYATKTYPPEKMRQVACYLADKGMNVYLFGGRGIEAETLSTWSRDCGPEGGKIVSLAGRFPLEQEIALMNCLDVMVSMDSANQHLAGLAGTKVVSVWGSTTPSCGFLGFGQTLDDTVSLGLPCQPCSIAGSKSCPLGHMECLEALSVETIVDKVTSLVWDRKD